MTANHLQIPHTSLLWKSLSCCQGQVSSTCLTHIFSLPLQPHNYPYQLSCDVLVGHLEPCAGLFRTYLEYIYYRSLLLTCRRGALLHASKAKHLGFTGFWEVGKRHNKPPTQSQYPLLLPALLCSESLSVQSPHWCLHSGVSHAWSPLG